jgi:two-component system, OmpR family, phosphate regulon response regulator OmpR
MGGSGAVNSTPTSLPDDAAHVLVVDDDRRLRALLSSYLVKHGHRVTVAPTAAKARAFLDGLAFDIIVLDVMMPVENGFDFAADLRTRSQVPILMLTARGEPQDRVRGLEIGVDDYLAKPFEPRELLLRIGSVLRRTRAPPAGSVETSVVRFGRFAFSLERGELRAGDDPVRITEREREMLRLLSANPGAIVSREALSGSGGAAQERTVDVLVNRLRRKIEQDPTNPIYLQTARGAGYRLVADR